ncbi:MAG TPA: FixH family protein [bacterium]|nr:FixH family protein [bacterium]HMW34817.1 FixH family protein [bacterium]HMY36079.1 FixH family protein [bacterium]HMZ02984.1 FixH family protein [bacterium]HNB10086.1 FixH family protein [bacterium]
MLRWLAIIIMTAFFISSCEKDKNSSDPVNDMVLIGQGYDQGVLVSVYSEDTLTTGYNAIYTRLQDSASGEILDEGHIHLSPLMHMTEMTHAAPYGNPESEEAEEGLFEGYVVFQMPGNDMEYWELEVEFHDHHSGKEGSVMIEPKVKSSNRCKVVTGTDAKSYILSWKKPRVPEVGLNTLELMVHERVSMMSFPDVTDATLAIEPTMPSMGHGSPNNVDPVYVSGAVYRGKVNFTMTGDWQVDVSITRNAATVVETHFDVTVD